MKGMSYAVFMSNKMSFQGITRVAKYAERAEWNGENKAEALERGRRLERKGRLASDGTTRPVHPDEIIASPSD
jgi:hypothetical protein